MAGALAGYLFTSLHLLNAPWKDSMLDKVVAACSILVAYLATAATIIPALEEKTIVRKLRSWGYFRYIVRYLRDAIVSSGLLLIMSLAIVPLPASLTANPTADRAISSAWWGLLALTVASVYRATSIVIKMVGAR